MAAIKYLALLIGTTCLAIPFFVSTQLFTLYITAGVFGWVLTWVSANLENGSLKGNREQRKERQAMFIGVLLCSVVGLGLITYYEMQMPKYRVALAELGDYKVPPHMDKKELKEMGADCNTYGNTQCSLAVFARIVELDSRDFRALANLAIAQSHMGQHKEAISNFQQAIQRGYVSFDVFQFYGDSLLALGDIKKAKVAYEQALMLNPELIQVKKKLSEL
ncbi:MAG: tetratricopeptide repeat protein [Bdellovibrionales bacterium]|nr:tetratricopeptide repeat protein [Bdellovibrionales bacterium]